jgi:hypothetical protein
MKKLYSLLFAVAYVLATPGPAFAGSPVTVVELYTSQGCNSCPPADEMLGNLAARDDVIALGLHVNYWDYLGWKDTFATDAMTSRQRTYGRTMRGGRVYTPQMVIGGAVHVVGSNRYGVEWAMLSDKHRVPNPVEVSFGADEAGTVIAQWITEAFDGNRVGVSLSLGIAIYDPAQPVGIDNLIRAADEPRYQAKARSRGSAQVALSAE